MWRYSLLVFCLDVRVQIWITSRARTTLSAGRKGFKQSGYGRVYRKSLFCRIFMAVGLTAGQSGATLWGRYTTWAHFPTRLDLRPFAVRCALILDARKYLETSCLLAVYQNLIP